MQNLRNNRTFYDPETHIWRGLPTPPLLNPDQSLGQAVLGILDRNRNKIVQISADSGVEITGAKMFQRTVRVAQNLIKLGFQSDPEILFTMIVRNGEHTAPVLFACFALGIPVNTLDPTFQRDDLAHMLASVKPKLVFCESETLGELMSACEFSNISPKIILLGDKIAGYPHVDDLLVPTGIEDSFVPIHLDNPSKEMAVLLCSSGTTGRSKAVCLSHSICIAHCANFFECHSSDILFAYSSLYWLSGLMMLLAGTLYGATRIITREPFTVQRTLDIIQRYQVSVLFIPPTQAWAIVSDPAVTPSSLSSLRLPFSGGSVVSASLKRSFEKLFAGKFLEIAYGFSEVGFAVTFTREKFYRDGSVGFPRAGVEIKIVDEDNCALGIGQEGEILVRAKYVFLGYYGNQGATEEMLDEEGWLHTGDIGRFDEDGLMFVVDRKKDIIKYGNYQISPSDVETVIMSVPGVGATCVVGIPQESGNDLVTALVVCKSQPLDSDFIVREAKKKLPDYKHLRGGVHFVDQLPMTPSGKVLRRLAKEIVMKKRSSAP